MGNKRLAYSDSHRKTDLATGIANGIAILPGQPPAVEWRDTRRRRYSDTPRDLQHNFCQQLMRPEAPKVLPQPQLHGAAQKKARGRLLIYCQLDGSRTAESRWRAAKIWGGEPPLSGPTRNPKSESKSKRKKIKNKIPWPRGLNTKLQKRKKKKIRKTLTMILRIEIKEPTPRAL